jgi:hypothetical protein
VSWLAAADQFADADNPVLRTLTPMPTIPSCGRILALLCLATTWAWVQTTRLTHLSLLRTLTATPTRLSLPRTLTARPTHLSRTRALMTRVAT